MKKIFSFVFKSYRAICTMIVTMLGLTGVAAYSGIKLLLKKPEILFKTLGDYFKINVNMTNFIKTYAAENIVPFDSEEEKYVEMGLIEYFDLLDIYNIDVHDKNNWKILADLYVGLANYMYKMLKIDKTFTYEDAKQLMETANVFKY